MKILGQFTVIVLAIFVYQFVAMGDELARYDLQPKWEAGQETRYRYETTRKHHVVEKYRGMTQSYDLKYVSTGQVVWAVIEVKPDGSYVCTMTNEWRRIEYTGPDGRVQVLDSRSQDVQDEEQFRDFTASIGVPLKFDVAADGTILDVSGVEVIDERQGLKGPVEPRKKVMHKRNASSMAILEGAPERVSEGEKWEVQLTWPWVDRPYRGQSHHDMTYTLSRIERNEDSVVAVIDAQSEPEIEIDYSMLPADTPPFDVEFVKTEVSIQIRYDLNRHEALHRQTKQVVTVDYDIHYPGDSAQRRLEQVVEGSTTRIVE